MFTIENISAELSLVYYDEYSKSGVSKELKDFLLGKVISFMKYDLSAFKTGKNTRRYFKIVSIEFEMPTYKGSMQWIVKLKSCSKNGLINERACENIFSLGYLLRNIVNGKVSISESKKDGRFRIKSNGQLTELKMKLNGQKSHYKALKCDLEETEKRIKDLEEQIKNFGK